MRVSSITVVIIAAAVLCVGVATVRGQAAKSVWDGVYSAEQSKRGADLYAAECASCHGDTLTGAEMAPALAGGEFNSNWNDLPVSDLVERIRISMPLGAPGKLTRQQCADILAYMLEVGMFPAGSAELPAALDALRPIKFLAHKP